MVIIDYHQRLGHDNHRRLGKVYGWKEARLTKFAPDVVARAWPRSFESIYPIRQSYDSFLLNRQLQAVEMCVLATAREKLLVGSLFDDAPFVQDNNAVRKSDSR
jgi:hypothetical protein